MNNQGGVADELCKDSKSGSGHKKWPDLRQLLDRVEGRISEGIALEVNSKGRAPAKYADLQHYGGQGSSRN